MQHELPAERAHTLSDADQARAGRRLPAVADRKADAVVLDLQAELAADRRQGDAHAPGASMAGGIGERLLRDAVEGGLHLGRQARRWSS